MSDVIIIPALPGFYALSFFVDDGGSLRYEKLAIIAWHLHVIKDVHGEHRCHHATPVLPGFLGSHYQYDAIQSPDSSVISLDEILFDSLDDCLAHWAAESGLI